MALVVVGHHECDFGFGSALVAIESSHSDQGAVDFSYQGQPIDVVDAGKALDFLRRQGWVEGEEAQIAGVR